MGEAKRRGSYEERKAEAGLLNSIIEEERRHAKQLEELSLTPEQRKARKDLMMLSAFAFGAASL